MPFPVFGDFLASASEHLKVAVIADDGQITRFSTVPGDLHHLVAVMSRYCDDLAPCDVVEAVARNDLNGWERAAIETDAALRIAVSFLRRAADEIGGQVNATAPSQESHLAAAANELAAGRDLLHTHFATNPDGLIRDSSEWARVVNSLPITRALMNEIAQWSGQLAPYTAWLAGSPARRAQRSMANDTRWVRARSELAKASQWLQAASATVRPAVDTDPVQPADTELLCAIPASGLPPRQRPGLAEESVTDLCHGITISASRLRGTMRNGTEGVRWSPGVTSGGWQWMTQAAAVTSHLSELTLRSLATQASQLDGLTVSGIQLNDAANSLASMRAAWHRLDSMWDRTITESRLLPTPAMTEASDLVLRMGRLVWDNPHWTPAHSHRAPPRPPALLAPEPATLKAVVAATHHAIDALAFVAKADSEAVQAAAWAHRLYVPTRSLPDGYDVPRPFATAPVARSQELLEAYHIAHDASMQAAQALDELTLTAGTSSRVLALARAAAATPPHRRSSPSRLDDGHPNGQPPADITDGPPRHSRASTGQAGPVEQALRDREISDEGMLIRAAAIDNAAQRLMTQAENATPAGMSPNTSHGRRHTADNAAQLAAQNFPPGKVARPSTGYPSRSITLTAHPGNKRTRPLQ